MPKIPAKGNKNPMSYGMSICIVDRNICYYQSFYDVRDGNDTTALALVKRFFVRKEVKTYT